MLMPLATMLALMLATTDAAAQDSGVQVTPDAEHTLISKDVDGERWAISLNGDGTATGNVFFPDGSEPAFVWCSETGETGETATMLCLGADRCENAPCAPEGWRPIGEIDVPQEFLLPPGPPPGTWQTLPALAGGPRQEHPTVALRREIYVVGGFLGSGAIVSSLEAFDVASGVWRSDIAPLPVEMHHANVAVAAGKIYVLGFLTGGSFTPHGRTFSYDPSENRWSELAPMPAGTARGASGVATIGQRIYVAGGLGEGVVDDFSVYDTISDSWESLPSMPLPLDHLAAAAVDGVFYALGGRGGAITGISGAVHAFDPETMRWTRRSDMPTPRGGVASAVAGGKIYVLGGEGNPEPDSQGVFDDVEAYDPAADTWSVQPPMPVPRHGMGAVGLGGRIYVPGGATQQAFGAVDTFDVLAPAP